MNTWIQRLLEVPYTDTTSSSARSSKVNANTTEKERAKLNCGFWAMYMLTVITVLCSCNLPFPDNFLCVMHERIQGPR